MASVFPAPPSGGVFGSSTSVFPQVATLDTRNASGADPLQFGAGSAASPMVQSILASQKELAGAFGVPEELATPNAARGSNEAALAKLATVNPELAQQITDNMEGEAPDQGLWDNIKDTLGDIAAPALSVGGKLLEVLSRPAQIIPELIVDEDDDPWYEDVGQALSGNSTARGADVMRKFGIDHGVMEGALGFAFDVVADPITWVTFGGAGFGRAAISRTAGAQVAESALQTSIRDGIKAGAISLGDDQVADVSTRLIQNAMGKKVSRDAKEGLTAFALDGLDDAVVARAIEKGDFVARGISTRTLRKTPGFKSASGEIVDTDSLLSVLRDNRTNQALTSGQRKMAAGALGGMRFRAFGYISPAIPGTESIGFGAASNFFRGYSGSGRLMSTMNRSDVLIGEGVDKTVQAGVRAKDLAGNAFMSGDDFQTFAMGGWTGLKETNPDLYHYLKGSGIPGGSMMMSLSEQMGKITAHLTPHAWLVRGGGLVGQMATQGNIAARDSVIEFASRYGYALRDSETDKVVMSARAGMKKLNGMSGMDDETMRNMRRFLDMTPDEVAESGDIGRGLREWAETRVSHITDDIESNDAIENMVGPIEDAWKALDPSQQEGALLIKKLQRQHRTVANRQGAHIDDVTSSMSHEVAARREQVDEWVRDGHTSSRGELYLVPEGTQGRGIASQGFDPTIDRNTGGYGRGVVVTDQVDGLAVDARNMTDDAVPVAVRLESPIVVDESVNALTEKGILDEKYADAFKVIDNHPEKYKMAVDADDWDVTRQAWGDELVTESLVKEGRDGIVHVRKDGTRQVTVFRSEGKVLSKIKAVSDSAPTIVDTQGYYGRNFTSRFTQWMKGMRRDDAEAVQRVFTEENARRHIHLNVDDAEAAIKRELVEELERGIRNTSGVQRNQMIQARKELAHVDVFTVNPVDGLHNYVQHVAQGIADNQLGYLGKRMQRMSDLGAFGFGGAVQHTAFSFIDDAAKMREIDGVLAKGMRSIDDKAQPAAQRALHQLTKARATEADEFARLRDALGGSREADRLLRAGRKSSHIMQGIIGRARRERADLLKLEKKVQSILDSSPNATDDILRDMGYPPLSEVQEQLVDNSEYVRDILAASNGKLPKGASSYLLDDYARFGFQEEAGMNVGRKAAGEAAKASKRVGREWQKYKRMEADFHDVMHEVNKLQANYHTKVNDIRPALEAVSPEKGIRRGWKAVEVRGFEGVAMPKYIATEFENAVRKQGLQGVNRYFRDVTNVWKRMATIYWPGFHIRNNYGAMFNNWLAGTTARDYRWMGSVRKGSDDIVPANFLKRYNLGHWAQNFDETPTWADVKVLVSESGVTGSNITLDSRNMVDVIGRNAGIKSSGEKLSAKVSNSKVVRGGAHVAEKSAELSENLHRTAGFLSALRQNGGDIYGARMSTMMRHGDYADLTDFEFKTAKTLLPFYKWMRTNFPYQLRQLIENPAKQLATVKAGNAAFEVQGIDPDEAKRSMPEWLRQGQFAIPIGKPDNKKAMNLMIADLPMADLYTGMNEYLSAFLPTVRPFLESFGTEKATFTGAPLTGEMKEVEGWMAMPGIRDLLSASGLAKEKDGSLFISDKLENILQGVPVYSRFRNFVMADETRVKGRMNTLASVFTGVGLRPIDEETMTAVERSFYYDEIQPAIEQAQEMGWVFPDKDQVSDVVYSQLGFTPPADSESGGGVLPTVETTE